MVRIPGMLRRSSGLDAEDDSTSSARFLCQDPCAEQLIRSGRYCHILDVDVNDWETDAIEAAWQVLGDRMAVVPSGVVSLDSVTSKIGSLRSDFQEHETVAAFLIDRQPVTNAEYGHFVQYGGYDQHDLWPSEVLPYVLQFLDQTGCPGPRYWNNGQPPRDRLDHPVVGISWYEANAFANWVGKRLATSAEWQRAGTWWREGVRYPWGSGFEKDRANTWSSDGSSTVSVHDYASGMTPNGVGHLIGNVWEWVFGLIDFCEVESGQVLLQQPLAEIRGGAFDTYLPSQATCTFRSGARLFDRVHNIGFRCCVAQHVLRSRGDQQESDHHSFADDHDVS